MENTKSLKRLSKTIFIFALTMALFSCEESEKSAQELVDTSKDKAQAKFEQFYKCYEIAQTTPVVTKNSIKWEAEDVRTDYPKNNVYAISLQSFKDLSLPLNLPFDGVRRSNHADMAKLFGVDLTHRVEKHDFGTNDRYSYHSVESGTSCYNEAEHFLNSKYLVISRVTKVVTPYPIDDKFYSPGSVDGDALVFDLNKAKLIGGYIIDVTSKGQISVQANQAHKIYDNLEAKLEMSVEENVFREFMKLAPFVSKENTGSSF